MSFLFPIKLINLMKGGKKEMKKIFVFAVILCMVLSIGVIAGDDSDGTDLIGNLQEVLTINVDVESINFGDILQGPDVTANGDDVTIDTTGSDTESDMVYVSIELTQDTDGFYAGLLEMAISPDGEFRDINIVDDPELTEGGAITYMTRLQGDTEQFQAGSKTGRITYTVYAPMEG
jgi:hypothetical protein